LIGISDITADINGSIEILEKYTTPDEPFFVYNPKNFEYTYETIKS